MDIEAELLKALGAGQLEAEVAAKIKSFHGLLTREVAVRLIAKEKGLLRDEEKEYALAEIPKGARKIKFTAAVKKVWPVATYSSGKKSRVVEIAEGETVKPLVLWNQDVELAKGLRTRDRISVRGAYEKNGELHLGYNGTLEISHKAAFSDLDALEEGQEVHVRGFVSAVEGHGSFIRDGKTLGGFSFMLSDGKNERRCVMTEGLGRADRLKVGDEVLVEDGLVSRGNIDISSSRLLTRRKSDMLLGRIVRLECMGHGAGGKAECQGRGTGGRESLLVDVEGKELVLDRANALKFLGVSVADDILLSTVAALKKDNLVNSRIAVRISHKDGRTLIA
jgi:hypothetical protein